MSRTRFRIAAILLIAVVLMLSPIIAALPDGSSPAQPLWSSWLCVLVMAAALLGLRDAESVGVGGSRPRLALWAFLILLGLAFLSMVLRLVRHHSFADLGPMLHGWGTLAVDFALFALCRHAARRGRGGLYALLAALLVGTAYVAAGGAGEYAIHVLAGERSWRVFGTSTPDFLAGFLVLALPVTLALFLSVPISRASSLLAWLCVVLLGLIFILSLLTLLTTGSRFALVSLAAALAVFAGALAAAVRRGLPWPVSARWRLGVLAAILLLPSLVFAKPVLSRLHSGDQGNSGAFRLWTWRGAVRMAEANPVLGTGIGAWVDDYPRYALTGFTRLAHNGYLQMADECGIPALLALVVTLGFAGSEAALGLRSRPAPTAAPVPMPLPKPGRRRKERAAPAPAAKPVSPLAGIMPVDDRLILCGLLSALAAGVVQNLIDSDWYVFFLGVTFWALAGLAAGISGRQPVSEEERRPSPRPRFALPAAAAAAVSLVLFGGAGIGAWFGSRAAQAAEPAEAQMDYRLAAVWNPLDADYPAGLAIRVYDRTGNLAAAEASLRQAAALEPSGVNDRRLGNVLDEEGRRDQAAAVYRAGARVDPNSLDLLLALARDSAPGAALEVYRRIAALEDSPVGQVRAIGEVTEVKFAIADAALGHAAAAAGNMAAAVRDDARAQRLMEAYADEDGTMNPERQAEIGSHPDPLEDRQIQGLYAQVMAELAAAAPPAQAAAIERRAQDYALRFDGILAQGYAALADASADAAQAAAGYSRAAQLLQAYADGGGARLKDAQGGVTGAPDAALDGQMSGLYKHVMDRLSSAAPPGEQAGLQAAEQRYLQKFARLFPQP